MSCLRRKDTRLSTRYIFAFRESLGTRLVQECVTPRPPPLFVLRFAFSAIHGSLPLPCIIHYTECKLKNKQTKKREEGLATKLCTMVSCSLWLAYKLTHVMILRTFAYWLTHTSSIRPNICKGIGGIIHCYDWSHAHAGFTSHEEEWLMELLYTAIKESLLLPCIGSPLCKQVLRQW